MKKYLFIVSFYAIPIPAQLNKVGINTDNPQRTLDVNGDLRVKTLENKNIRSDYDKVLVYNPNSGEIDHLPKSYFGPFLGRKTANSRNVPIDANTIYTSETSLGCISIRYRRTTSFDGFIQLKTCEDEYVTAANDSQRTGAYLASFSRFSINAETWSNLMLYNYNNGQASYQGIIGLFNSNTSYKVNVNSFDGTTIAITIQQLTD